MKASQHVQRGTAAATAKAAANGSMGARKEPELKALAGAGAHSPEHFPELESVPAMQGAVLVHA